MNTIIKKECISKLVRSLKKCLIISGPSAVNIKAEVKGNTINIGVFEAPTEIIYGPLDGSEMLYGFSFSPTPLRSIMMIEDILFITSDQGINFFIKGKMEIKDIGIKVNINVCGEPPEESRANQRFDTINNKYKSIPKPKNIVATIRSTK